jgi:hypothetical protein
MSLCWVLCLIYYYYAECRYAECHYAECSYAECHYAECSYAECSYAECHVGKNIKIVNEYPGVKNTPA